MISPIGLNRNNVYPDIFHKYTSTRFHDSQLGTL